MIKEIIDKRIIDRPFPIFVDLELFDGEKIKKIKNCNNECLQCTSNEFVTKCQNGFSFIKTTIHEKDIIVPCLYIPESEINKRTRKNVVLMQQKTSLTSINSWLAKLRETYINIFELVNKTAKNNFDQFHEFVKWAREINHYSERLLTKSNPSRIIAFQNASEDLKSLYKTSVMLLDSLDTAALYFNPESAKFGRKSSTDIYSLVHKISTVLSHSKSNKNRLDISIRGKVFNKHHIYESFKVIPLSLLQNAIKYRKTGDIEVVFDEYENSLNFSVVSIGDHIPEEEIQKLFLRGYRTAKAKRMTVEGSGLGLYVLKLVADAHEFPIHVESIRIEPANKNLAKNIFTVQIH